MQPHETSGSWEFGTCDWLEIYEQLQPSISMHFKDVDDSNIFVIELPEDRSKVLGTRQSLASLDNDILSVWGIACVACTA